MKVYSKIFFAYQRNAIFASFFSFRLNYFFDLPKGNIEMSRRKSRLQEQVATQDKKIYKDIFQEEGERHLNEILEKISANKRLILYVSLAVVALAVLAGVYYVRSKRIDAGAQLALSKAIEIAEAPITETPPLAGVDQKSFRNEKERAEAAIAEFQKIADNYGSPYREKALYFIAVNKVYIDRQAAISELESLANRKDEIGKLSKFALAQAKEAEGRYDEAVALYQELSSLPDAIISKETIEFNLARVYEKQGRRPEAAEIYYNIVKTANEAKTAEGNTLPQTQIVREARERLEVLDPDRAKELKEQGFSSF